MEFYSKLYIEQSDNENLICFCFYYMDYHNTFLEKKTGGSHANYLSGGPNLSPPPHISSIIQYKTLRRDCFAIFMAPYYLYEVNKH